MNLSSRPILFLGSTCPGGIQVVVGALCGSFDVTCLFDAQSLSRLGQSLRLKRPSIISTHLRRRATLPDMTFCMEMHSLEKGLGECREGRTVIHDLVSS
jgi:hypothetical protein